MLLRLLREFTLRIRHIKAVCVISAAYSCFLYSLGEQFMYRLNIFP